MLTGMRYEEVFSQCREQTHSAAARLNIAPSLEQSLGYRLGQFPHAEKSFEASISLAMYPDMTDLEQDQVAEALYDIAREHRR
jgi:dTDP-4-amino-4,6-dideoxygalactose transaminase